MKTREQLLKDLTQQIIKSCVSIKDHQIKVDEGQLDKLIKDYVESENKSLFKFPDWLNEDRLGEDPMVWVITEEMIQIEAESEIDRRLTDIELHRVFHCQYEGDETVWNRTTMIREAIHEAIDDPDPWSYLDSCFFEEKAKQPKQEGEKV